MRTRASFLTILPWPLVPLLRVPLAVGVGPLGGLLWYAVPTTGALALLRGTSPPYPALPGVVLHVPVIFGMIGALVMLDDLEDGALQVIRVSPLGVPRYLAYRLGAVTVAAGLAIAAPLSSLVPGLAAYLPLPPGGSAAPPHLAAESASTCHARPYWRSLLAQALA